MNNLTPISDYKGVKRYVKYVGSQHIKDVYLISFYDVFHFDFNEDGSETKSIYFNNKRVELKATNEVAVDSKGDFIYKNEDCLWVNSDNEVILNENEENAKIGESGIIGQLNFLENVAVSLNTLTSLEIERADALKRFDNKVNNIDIFNI